MDDQGINGFEGEAQDAARHQSRDSLFMQASLWVQGAPAPVTVRIRNLSPGGLLAETSVAVVDGLAVNVELKNVGPVSGKIVWTAPGRFGVAFDRPVDPFAVRRRVVADADVPPTLSGLSRLGGRSSLRIK
ncbi:MAG: hypothetical protein RLZZ58_1254 [Pseudomonadota bacterium]|jgi:hypothetical protein